MINKDVVDKMNEGKEKEFMKILAERGKPYEKKHDGYAARIEKDTKIVFTDSNNTEMTMALPEGSYLMVGEDSSYPQLVTEKEFNDSNKFCEGHEMESKEEAHEEHEAKESPEKEKREEKEEKKEGKKESPKIGLESMNY